MNDTHASILGNIGGPEDDAVLDPQPGDHSEEMVVGVAPQPADAVEDVAPQPNDAVAADQVAITPSAEEIARAREVLQQAGQLDAVAEDSGAVTAASDLPGQPTAYVPPLPQSGGETVAVMPSEEDPAGDVGSAQASEHEQTKAELEDTQEKLMETQEKSALLTNIAKARHDINMGIIGNIR